MPDIHITGYNYGGQEFIDLSGYTSGIPSVSVVKAEGIDLGEVNIKLLTKIEELTLYLINQDQSFKTKIEMQEAKIRLLTERLNEIMKSNDDDK